MLLKVVFKIFKVVKSIPAYGVIKSQENIFFVIFAKCL
jgi:hypothetical protein